MKNFYLKTIFFQFIKLFINKGSNKNNDIK